VGNLTLINVPIPAFDPEMSGLIEEMTNDGMTNTKC